MSNLDSYNTISGMLDPQQAHLWLLDLERHRPECYSADDLVLDDSERDRVQVFRSQRERQQYCLSRTAIRYVLSSYYPDIQPAQWRFSKNPHGKPAIAAPLLAAPLYFNISHSGRWLAIAVARNKNIGVDVERMSGNRAMMAIARRYFTSQECSELCDLAPDDLRYRFYGLWTLKEAYSKACGYALVPTLGELGIKFSKTGFIEAELQNADISKKDLPCWYLRLFEMEGYQLSLAMRCEQETSGVNVIALEIDDPLRPGIATVSELEPCRLNR